MRESGREGVRRAARRGGDPRREDHRRLPPARRPAGGEHPRAARPARRAGRGAQECDRDPPRIDREPHPPRPSRTTPCWTAWSRARSPTWARPAPRAIPKPSPARPRTTPTPDRAGELEPCAYAPGHADRARANRVLHPRHPASQEPDRPGPLYGDALRVAVLAPPVAGRANAACVKALAKALGVPRGAVEIDPAARSRRKRVWVTGDPKAIGTRLQALASGE